MLESYIPHATEEIASVKEDSSIVFLQTDNGSSLHIESGCIGNEQSNRASIDSFTHVESPLAYVFQKKYDSASLCVKQET